VTAPRLRGRGRCRLDRRGGPPGRAVL